MNEPDPFKVDEENPEWTDADFGAARPAKSVMDPAVYAAVTQRRRGRQKAPTKRLISLRLDPDVVEHFRSTGSGWQSRINDALRAAIGKG